MTNVLLTLLVAASPAPGLGLGTVDPMHVDQPEVGNAPGCDVPAALREELGRLLQATGRRQSSDQGCFDGPRVIIDLSGALACDVRRDDAQRTVKLTWVLNSTTHNMGRGRRAAASTATQSQKQEVEVRFVRSAKGWQLELPEAMPGLKPGALGKEHQLGCSRPTEPPFAPRALAL